MDGHLAMPLVVPDSSAYFVYHEIVQKGSTGLSKHFTVVLTKAASLKLDVKMNFLVNRTLNKSVFLQIVTVWFLQERRDI